MKKRRTRSREPGGSETPSEQIVRPSERFLKIANRYSGTEALLAAFVAEIKAITGCEAVGVRILDEAGNIPYQAYDGFSLEFYESENPLSIRSHQCMCINVITGKVDPQRVFYTDVGSFYINASTRFLATVTEEEKGSTRNACNAEGYESVALVPIRLGDSILGLIHLADTRENMVPRETVEMIETVAMQLGVAFQRARAEEDIKSVAQFLLENPHPMLRIARDGTLLYANEAGVSLLAELNSSVGQLAPGTMAQVAAEAIDFNMRNTIDISHGERTFSFTVIPVAEANYANLYGGDITERKQAEEALKQSEKRYAMAQSAANVGSWDWNIQTGALYWSVQIEPMFGFGRGAFGATYEAFLECVHSEDRQYVVDSISACIDAGEEYAIEHRIVWPDGTVRWLSETGDVVRDEVGRAIHMLGIVQDITDHKQAEQALTISEANYRAIFDSVNDAIMVHDPENGQPLDINRRMSQLLGYTQEELLCMQIEDWSSDDPAFSSEIAVDKINMAAQGAPQIFEWRCKHKDGGLIWVEVNLRCSVVGGEDRVLAVIRDITERKRAEEDIENVARFPSENPSPIMRISHYGTLLYANDASTSLLNEWDTRIGSRVPEDISTLAKKVLDSGTLEQIEVEHRDRTFSFSVVPVAEAGYVNFYGQDVTERRQAETAFQWELQVNTGVARLSSALISETMPVADIATRVLDEAKSLTGSEHGFVSEIDPDTRDSVSHTLTEMMEGQCKVSEKDKRIVFECGDDGKYGALWGHSLNTHQGFFTNSPPQHEASTGIPEGHVPIHRFLSVPAMLGLELVGQIALANPRRNYTERDVAAVSRLAELYALAIGRARVQEELRHHRDRLQELVDERTAALRRSRQQLRDLAANVQAAREEERISVAREIHDELGQVLTALKFDLSWLEKRVSDTAESDLRSMLIDKIRSMTELSDTTICSVKRISASLRPPMLDQFGLLAAIEWHAEQFQEHTEIRCTVSSDVDKIDFNGATLTALFRIVQEALTNVARHAKATTVDICFGRKPGVYTLTVKDNGNGATKDQIANAKSLGIVGMQERALAVGGELQINGDPNAGTIVTVTIPHVERNIE